jgi:hypothetical protein
MDNPPKLKLVTPAKDEPKVKPVTPKTFPTQQGDGDTATPVTASVHAPVRKAANSQIRLSENLPIRNPSPPKLRVLSAAEKADREVNEILIRRLMRALLADDRKAA